MSCAQVLAQAQYSLQPRLNQINAPDALLGIWGTASQCAAHKTGKEDDPRLFPYVIARDWIKQGLRDYQVELRLHNGKLRIQWSEDFTTRELGACR